MLQAAIKQREVDERIELDDAQVLAILDKMIRQRRDAFQQFEAGHRMDLAEKEAVEIQILEEFLPEPLTEEAILALIDQTVLALGATSIRDMGGVLAVLKPQLQGRADIGKVSQWVKERLSL
jgi:hypothetical protein